MVSGLGNRRGGRPVTVRQTTLLVVGPPPTGAPRRRQRVGVAVGETGRVGRGLRPLWGGVGREVPGSQTRPTSDLRVPTPTPTPTLQGLLLSLLFTGVLVSLPSVLHLSLPDTRQRHVRMEWK